MRKGKACIRDTCPSNVCRELALIAPTNLSERTVVALDRHRATSAAPVLAIIPVCAVATAIVVAVVTTIRAHPHAANRRIDPKRLRRRRCNEGDTRNRYYSG